MSNFYKILQSAKNEKDVENYYREHFNERLKKLSVKDPNISYITSPYKTDGYLKYSNKEQKINLNCLFEFKYDVDFSNKTERCKVIIQSLYYLKKFELAGEFYMPTMLFIGDKNECFYTHTNYIIKYLGYKLDWNIAPSEAGSKNDALLMEMIQDPNLENIYVVDIDENFNFLDTLKHINEVSNSIKSKFRITNQNVHIILSNFLKKVLNEKKLPVNDEVNLFIQTLLDRVNNYQHPNKPNVLVTKGFGDIKINGANYKSFINFFDVDLSPSEKEILTATQDRLIQDETRRKQGEFFTPTVWVNEAHKMISEQFGEDWKEEYVVWDCAWGTGNLTRDYKFKELYCSTLVGSDIETANQAGYNPEAVKFQYDFLNDGIIDGKIDVLGDLKLPEGLKKAILEGKQIIFFINPPYGTAGSGGAKSTSKKGIASTEISLKMKSDNWGASTRNLYAQFLYKLIKYQEINRNIKISIFTPPLFLTGDTYKIFREKFFSKFQFKKGYLINANNFGDVKEWGLIFSIWDIGTTNESNFLFIKKEIYGVEIKNSIKILYNIDTLLSSSDWVRNKIKNEKLVDTIQLSSSLTPSQSNVNRIVKNSIGYLLIKSNKVNSNTSEVSLYTSASSNRGGVSITNKNYIESVSLFTARKTIKSDWINQKDEYIAPTEEIQQTDKYKQFEADSIVYSLFNTSSNQSSMRQVEYKDKLWDIKNEFFWMSATEMLELAETYKFDELYKDAKLAPERYVYELLKTTNLSKDARELLEMSKELVRKTFEWRKIMHQTNPEYHLNAWDAGWYQIKKILNEHFKEDLATFNSKYKVFENRMRPQVYQLGFLRDDNREYDEEYQQELKDKKFNTFIEDNLDF